MEPDTVDHSMIQFTWLVLRMVQQMSRFHLHVYCTGSCTDGDVRLVNGTTSNEGRVEYCDEGRWSAFCTSYSSFSSQTAYAICRELGYISNSCKN